MVELSADVLTTKIEIQNINEPAMLINKLYYYGCVALIKFKQEHLAV